MHEQAEASEKRLRDLFDPNLYPSARADFLLRSKELTTALSFYLKRAVRYGLFRTDRLREALEFVDGLDAGFTLDLTSLGIVFERQASGAHIDEEEPGFTVHRFGSDVARRLLAKACGDRPAAKDSTDSGSTPPDNPPSGGLASADAATDSLISSFASTLQGAAAIAIPPLATSDVRKQGDPRSASAFKETAPLGRQTSSEAS